MEPSRGTPSTERKAKVKVITAKGIRMFIVQVVSIEVTDVGKPEGKKDG
jgi:hypothetical protein